MFVVDWSCVTRVLREDSGVCRCGEEHRDYVVPW